MAGDQTGRKKDKAESTHAGSGPMGPDLPSDGQSNGHSVSGGDGVSLPDVIRADRVSAPLASGRFIDGLKLGSGPKRISAPNDETLQGLCPFLWELLTLDQYSDGSPRALAEIVLRRVPGGYEASVRDHASRQAKAVTFLESCLMWEALEAVLCDPTRPWKVYDSYLVPDPDKPKPNQQKRT